jgi:hypothetical protein
MRCINEKARTTVWDVRSHCTKSSHSGERKTSKAAHVEMLPEPSVKDILQRSINFIRAQRKRY